MYTHGDFAHVDCPRERISMSFYSYRFGVKVKVVNIDYVIATNRLNVLKEFLVVKTPQLASLHGLDEVY